MYELGGPAQKQHYDFLIALRNEKEDNSAHFQWEKQIIVDLKKCFYTFEIYEKCIKKGATFTNHKEKASKIIFIATRPNS